MATIHASAIVDSNAELADDVVIGPYAVIGAHVKMGSVALSAHTVLSKDIPPWVRRIGLAILLPSVASPKT